MRASKVFRIDGNIHLFDHKNYIELLGDNIFCFYDVDDDIYIYLTSAEIIDKIEDGSFIVY